MRVLLILFLFSAPLWAQEDFSKAIQLPIEKYQLKNGLTVLLHEERTIPSVSVQTWFRVGSKDEVPGRTGLAHFFEHMMFKGTPKFPKETFGRFLNSKGAETNAFTSNDYTGYYINLPSEHLELALQIESDRMRNLTLDPKDVASEREVVKEERRSRYDDSIEGGVREEMARTMYKSLPYKWLPIGSIKDLNEASMDDLHAFYKTYYSPNNAVLVIAGDFKTEKVKAMIEKYYAPLPHEEIKRVAIAPEAPQTKERRAVIRREAQSPSLTVAYPLPDMQSPDFFALDLLAVIMGEGASSRLYRRLVYNEQLATSVGSYSYGQALAGGFYFMVQLKPKMNPEKALKILNEEIEKMKSGKVTSQELEKARTVFFRDRVDSLKKVSGRARILAEYQTQFGDYSRIFSEMENYQKVTAEDVQSMAKKYLVPAKRNVVTMLPKQGGK